MVDRRDLIEGRLVDVADHGHLGLRGYRGHRGAVAATDAPHTDDSNLNKDDEYDKANQKGKSCFHKR